jgi:hypothetical protein
MVMKQLRLLDDVKVASSTICGNIEEWKPFDEAPGYEVSSLGRFRHRDRGILRGTLNHNGYQHIGFTIDKIQKPFLAHRVVAKVFIPNPDDHPVVNHIDGNRLNNTVKNLEWASRSYNSRDAWRRKKEDLA